jgi:hypothetical protein
MLMFMLIIFTLNSVFIHRITEGNDITVRYWTTATNELEEQTHDPTRLCHTHVPYTINDCLACCVAERSASRSSQRLC